MIGWQEIAVRLLFAFIFGSATAIDKRWYKTKQFIQSSTLMALGAGMFSLLISLTSEATFSPQLIIGISIVCVAVNLPKQASALGISMDTVMRLWFSGAVGSMVGFGFFVPAYIGILIVILTNLLFSTPEKKFTPNIEQEFKNNLEPDTELAQTAQPITPQENYYRCKIECLAVDEAEVLALLIQLSNKQKLMPTKISSKNLANNCSSPEIEIQVDFVCDSTDSPLQLQEVIMSLKSKLKIVSVSWIHLSPKSSGKNNQAASISELTLPKA